MKGGKGLLVLFQVDFDTRQSFESVMWNVLFFFVLYHARKFATHMANDLATFAFDRKRRYRGQNGCHAGACIL